MNFVLWAALSLGGLALTLDGTDRPNGTGAAGTTYRMLGLNDTHWPAAPDMANRSSARAISNALSNARLPASTIKVARNLLHLAVGQLISHDIALTKDSRIPMPICVPDDDVFYQPGQNMSFFESVRDEDSQIVNQVTHAIDASFLYGSSLERLADLRDEGMCMLRTSQGKNGDFISFNIANASVTNRGSRHGFELNTHLFLTGDLRSNENPALTALHTVWLREHNRQCRRLRLEHPLWSEAELFDRARRWVIALWQQVVFTEYAPALFGTALKPYQGYQPQVDLRVDLLFTSAAFRSGHSALPEVIKFSADSFHKEADVSLRECYYRPQCLWDYGLERTLLGSVSQRAEEVDGFYQDSVRNFLFGDPNRGMDLLAMSLQRGRDHQLPLYNQARVLYGLPPVTDWSYFTQIDKVGKQMLIELHPEGIDSLEVFAGGLIEPHEPGRVGPLFAAIIKDQLLRLRDGDEQYFDNENVTGLSFLELEEIQRTKFAHIMLRNTGITSLPCSVFYTDDFEDVEANAPKRYDCGRASSERLVSANVTRGYGNDNIYFSFSGWVVPANLSSDNGDYWAAVGFGGNLGLMVDTPIVVMVYVRQGGVVYDIQEYSIANSRTFGCFGEGGGGVCQKERSDYRHFGASASVTHGVLKLSFGLLGADLAAIQGVNAENVWMVVARGPLIQDSPFYHGAYKGALEEILPSSRSTSTWVWGILAVLLVFFLGFLIWQCAKLRRAKIEAEDARRETVYHKAQVNSKTTFFAQMSHELRTPMNGVLGLSDVLLQSPRLNEEDQEAVMDIKASGQHMLTLVNDMLDSAKIEAGMMKIDRTQLRIRDILDNVMLLCPPATGVELVALVQNDVPDIIYGDPTRITQVCLNLASHAMKATKSGHVALRLSTDHAHMGNGVSRCLMIDCEDTGPGLPRSKIKSIWTPVPAESSTGWSGPSSLPIVRMVAGLMGGEVHVIFSKQEGKKAYTNLRTVGGPARVPRLSLSESPQPTRPRTISMESISNSIRMPRLEEKDSSKEASAEKGLPSNQEVMDMLEPPRSSATCVSTCAPPPPPPPPTNLPSPKRTVAGFFSTRYTRKEGGEGSESGTASPKEECVALLTGGTTTSSLPPSGTSSIAPASSLPPTITITPVEKNSPPKKLNTPPMLTRSFSRTMRSTLENFTSSSSAAHGSSSATSSAPSSSSNSPCHGAAASWYATLGTSSAGMPPWNPSLTANVSVDTLPDEMSIQESFRREHGTTIRVQLPLQETGAQNRALPRDRSLVVVVYRHALTQLALKLSLHRMGYSSEIFGGYEDFYRWYAENQGVNKELAGAIFEHPINARELKARIVRLSPVARCVAIVEHNIRRQYSRQLAEQFTVLNKPIRFSALHRALLPPTPHTPGRHRLLPRASDARGSDKSDRGSDSIKGPKPEVSPRYRREHGTFFKPGTGSHSGSPALDDSVGSQSTKHSSVEHVVDMPNLPEEQSPPFPKGHLDSPKQTPEDQHSEAEDPAPRLVVEPPESPRETRSLIPGGCRETRSFIPGGTRLVLEQGSLPPHDSLPLPPSALPTDSVDLNPRHSNSSRRKSSLRTRHSPSIHSTSAGGDPPTHDLAHDPSHPEPQKHAHFLSNGDSPIRHPVDPSDPDPDPCDSTGDNPPSLDDPALDGPALDSAIRAMNALTLADEREATKALLNRAGTAPNPSSVRIPAPISTASRTEPNIFMHASSERKIPAAEKGVPGSEGKSFAAQYPLRLLIVDDNNINCKVVCRMLTALGYPDDSFRAVVNGQCAVDAYLECYQHSKDHPTLKPFDVVLMDLDMPVMNGLEATMEIVRLAKAASLAPPNIVALTAAEMELERGPCLRAGMVDAISKPLSLQKLQEVVQNYRRTGDVTRILRLGTNSKSKS